jgi:undecaprenyl diphosphate synthase
MIDECEKLTRENTGLELRLAVDYAGRWDILNAVKMVAKDVLNDEIKIDDLSEDEFANYLLAGDVPVDLLIRTSGEVRLSDFMLWQMAYAEMYFTDIMWPEFSKKELHRAVEWFYSRQRRFGKSGEQL